MKIFTVWSTTF